jgi:hypothetical protein
VGDGIARWCGQPSRTASSAVAQRDWKWAFVTSLGAASAGNPNVQLRLTLPAATPSLPSLAELRRH